MWYSLYRLHIFFYICIKTLFPAIVISSHIEEKQLMRRLKKLREKSLSFSFTRRYFLGNSDTRRSEIIQK